MNDAARVSELWDQVDDIFPGSRLTARRTPEDFSRFWSDRTAEHAARRRAETMAAVRLEQLQKRRR